MGAEISCEKYGWRATLSTSFDVAITETRRLVGASSSSSLWSLATAMKSDINAEVFCEGAIQLNVREFGPALANLRRRLSRATWLAISIFLMISSICAGAPDQKKSDSTLLIELPAPEGEVLQAVRTIAEDGVIHGTQIFAREPILDGAAPATSVPYFGKWQGGGHAFYKVRTEAIAPQHFKASADMGTISVRYVVEGLSAMNTKLQIDAVFVESGGRASPSDGNVETSEFKEIQDKIRAIEYEKRKDAEGLKAREAFDAANASPEHQRELEISRLQSAQTALQNLQARYHDLQHELEVRVKDSGAEMKSAPFHSATVLRPLPAHAELLILIVTPHWYGIETTDGAHGWINRAAVEPLP
jgi:hypothetical protein